MNNMCEIVDLSAAFVFFCYLHGLQVASEIFTVCDLSPIEGKQIGVEAIPQYPH
jgi:hypothetical protein